MGVGGRIEDFLHENEGNTHGSSNPLTLRPQPRDNRCCGCFFIWPWGSAEAVTEIRIAQASSIHLKSHDANREKKYAQIEKEALAFTWSCVRLLDYLTGLCFHIEPDRKPLVPHLSTKNLEELPLRVQRFCLRMMRYSFSITHVPVKQLVIADALSCAPPSEPIIQIACCKRKQLCLSTSSSIICQ